MNAHNAHTYQTFDGFVEVSTQRDFTFTPNEKAVDYINAQPHEKRLNVLNWIASAAFREVEDGLATEISTLPVMKSA